MQSATTQEQYKQLDEEIIRHISEASNSIDVAIACMPQDTLTDGMLRLTHIAGELKMLKLKYSPGSPSKPKEVDLTKYNNYEV